LVLCQRPPQVSTKDAHAVRWSLKTGGGELLLRALALTLALTLALVAAPLAADAQRPKMLHVGYAGAQPISSPVFVAFVKRMAELGYEQGQNFALEFVQVRNAAGFQDAYRELAARKVDIFVAPRNELALKAALAVAGPRPIVMIAVDFDPLARGYVPSLARPAGNVTGLAFQQIELTMKRVQLMKEGFPEMKAATVFWDRLSADQWQATQAAAATLGLRVLGVEFSASPYDYERAFAEVAPAFRDGLLVLASPIFALPKRERLPDFALRQRMPSMFAVLEYGAAGGLISYGPSFPDLFRRAAEYVDRIARGTKPADLPIERPTRFELVINLKTAKALGVTIPPSLLLRADRVFE